MVSQPSCKQQDRENHNEACKLSIEDISKPGNGNTSVVSRLIFSVLWGASFIDGRDVDLGGHAGIDIVSAKGTPVTAIGHGEVIRAGGLFGFGKSITIKHLYKDEYIYSNYSHLNTIEVKVGDMVKEEQKIGEIGNT